MIASNQSFQEAHNWLRLEESDFERADCRPGMNTSRDDLFAATFKTSQELGFSSIRSRALLHRAFAFGVRNSLSDVLHSDVSQDEKPVTLRFFEWLRENASQFTESVGKEFFAMGKALKRAKSR
jgi:hypothetical protein